MQLSTFYLHPKHLDRAPALEKVWFFREAHLSPIGRQSLTRLAEIRPRIEQACWQGLAIQEFAEVQDMTFPKAGRYFNINYFFFEGVTTLSEAVLSGVNGCVHASLATLRAVFEIFALHCHWKERRRNAETYDEFYAWISGVAKAPGFTSVIRSCYPASLPPGAVNEDDARSLYHKLCAYVHKPTLGESITTIRGGNSTGVSDPLLEYWLGTLVELQRHLIELLVRSSPAALFPIDVTRKFGFNPPMGLFFDPQSFAILEKALGKELIAAYRSWSEVDGAPPPEIQWARDRPDLTDAKILKSWHDSTTPRLEGKTKAEKFERGRMMLKAKTRVISQSLAYMPEGPSMPDIREILSNMRLNE